MALACFHLADGKGKRTCRRVEKASERWRGPSGMAAPAEFVKSDFSVFAHIHPAGSVPMVSLMIAQKDFGLPMDHSSMRTLPAAISFPYGFPQAGNYRLFVQVRRRGLVETGVLDAHVRD